MKTAQTVLCAFVAGCFLFTTISALKGKYLTYFDQVVFIAGDLYINPLFIPSLS